ncbi:MAG: ferritin-like domain-containing protein [Deltaproteobacteria bacterium]|nr:ferritin-like domain-containing protein [Deltaproteobacteria bacterium]
MGTSTYPRWLLSYYREAEVRSADLLQRLLRQADDPALQIYLTRQLADETHHIQMWTELMSELGEPPTALKRGYRHYLHKYTGMPSNVLDLLALTCVVEERVQQRYRDHIPQAGHESRIADTLQALVADEEWHVQGIRHWLAKLEKQEGRTRVAAALDYYLSLEELAYVDLIDEGIALLRCASGKHLQ